MTHSPLVFQLRNYPIVAASLRTAYPTTSIPIDLAVPETLLIAAATDAAFKSGIFCLAMSSTCFSVTLPTLSLFGAPEPLAIPAARFSKIAAGGVLVMKVNERPHPFDQANLDN